MVRSAIVAVLAVALSSTIAAAQSADHDVEIDILALNGFDTTAPAPMPVKFSRLSQHIDRAQVFFNRTKVRAVNMFAVARSHPRFELYTAQGALQVLDVFTTSRALNAGHREANPLLKSGNRGTMVLAKSASFGLQLYLNERLAERNPKAAKWVMVATNIFMSAVVVNNMSVGDPAAK